MPPSVKAKAAGGCVAVRLPIRPFRIFLDCSKRATKLTDRLQKEFAANRKPRKADSADFTSNCLVTLRLMVLNLAAVAISNRHVWLQVLANRTWYWKNRFWIGENVTQASVRVCRDFLISHGYAIFNGGVASRAFRYRRPSTLHVTHKFASQVRQLGITPKDIWRSPDQDLIQLRGPKNTDGTKQRVPFAENDQTDLMSKRLAGINRLLNSADIRLNVTASEWRHICTHIERKTDPEFDVDQADDLMLDLTQRSLYRVFNNGSFDQGGRFYGGWWQALPKKWRSYITINRRKIVELDYSAMHPTALSHELGIPVAPNFYEFGVGTKALVKATFNALINARGTSINAVQGFDEAEIGMSWEEFLRRVKLHYAPYKAFFGTGYGLKLQRLDSDIAEAVMLHFVERGKVVLPVHDSFLCEQRHEAELAFVMEEQFRLRTGGSISFKRKRLSPRQIAEIRARA